MNYRNEKVVDEPEEIDPKIIWFCGLAQFDLKMF